MKRKVLLMIVLFVCFSFSVLAKEKPIDINLLFVKAGANYQTENYMDAIKQYETILNFGFESASVYFNLGNAYFKSEKLGKALLNYERALRLDPRDPDIVANLGFAQSIVEVYGEDVGKGVFWSQARHQLRKISSEELSWLILILFFIWGGVVLLKVLNKIRMSSFISMFLSISFFLVISLGGYGIKQFEMNGASVVLAETKAKFEPMDNATDYFQLAEGVVVHKLKTKYGWHRIQRSDGRVGWVPQIYLEEI